MMLTESEALEHVLKRISPGPLSEVSLAAALGRYVARDYLAAVPIPSFDNSMMDGYAVHADETQGQGTLNIAGEQPAGIDLGLKCERGQAIRIFTGAPMPAGADAVIMQEDVDRVGDSILCRELVERGENIRRLGADLCVGQVMLRRGEKISAGRIGLLASQGQGSVSVHTAPQVAVISTGDELIQPGCGPLHSGQIYNSNGVMLQALLFELGIADTSTAHCPDTFADTVCILRSLIEMNDVIVLSGGVSVGDHDHIKPALLELGIPPDLWRVKVKPGKPFLFAQTTRSSDGRPVSIFGLPGNPVSSFVTFQLFVRPALLKWMGAAETAPSRFSAKVSQTLSNDGNRPHFLRGVLRDGIFQVAGLQQSHALFNLSQANALLRLEEGQTVAAGEVVTVLWL